MGNRRTNLFESIASYVNMTAAEKGTGGVVRRVKRRAYGRAADMAVGSVIHRIASSFDEYNERGLIPGSESELLARNPQNAKLVVLREWELTDAEGRQKYRFISAEPSLRKWVLYDGKRKVATLSRQKRSIFDKLFHKNQDRQCFTVVVRKQTLGNIVTRREGGRLIGETNFNSWLVEDRKIYADGNCLASLEKVKSWTERRYVLDYSKEMDEIVMILALFAMETVDA